MAKRSVYLETSVISYLAARPTRDLVQAAKQQTTREWWDFRRQAFDVYVSQFVLDEASGGDREAAERRMALLAGLPLLRANRHVIGLAQALIEEGVLPSRAGGDAVHIAMSAVHGVDFLLTWNCRHLANAEMMGSVSHLVLSKGYDAPIICTPDELMGDYACPEMPS